MNQKYTGSPFTHPEWYADAVTYPAAEVLLPPDAHWDPAEELASLLEGTARAEQPATVPPPRTEPAPGVDYADPMRKRARNTGQFLSGRHSPAGATHRKRRVQRNHIKWMRAGSFVIAAFVSVLVAMVSVFGGMAAYGPLRNATSGVNGGMIAWWPLLVYGPWMAASLSILRNALHQRRAVHSWCIVVLFSSVAMILCVAQADRTVTGVAGAALPAFASLACFQQLIRQITLTLPQSQEKPRHGR
ncbi:DUF2637 domain-containing protein [Streptomyces rubradiris]|uniref:DUF2637 domain-containing protein n=1 Tax=Streptomyces rubradiris TaxID=285531 RepID=A0ABQ3RPB5_STRRR|nr:DUF2637 domain-containing protein [Streptomyces rubradiris]GHH12305.1 hypothetical protein GCM10018792_37560 [Streptomyces rubradiris]GHI57617.1 hypothetical protein Srubr_74630 [Streptomyces rubradiris]